MSTKTSYASSESMFLQGVYSLHVCKNIWKQRCSFFPRLYWLKILFCRKSTTHQEGKSKLKTIFSFQPISFVCCFSKVAVLQRLHEPCAWLKGTSHFFLGLVSLTGVATASRSLWSHPSLRARPSSQSIGWCGTYSSPPFRFLYIESTAKPGRNCQYGITKQPGALCPFRIAWEKQENKCLGQRMNSSTSVLTIAVRALGIEHLQCPVCNL